MYAKKILSEFNLKIRIATEVEFYVEPGFDDVTENDFLAKLVSNIAAKNIRIWNVQKEYSPNQYEVALQPTPPETAIKEYEELKQIIDSTAAEFQRAAIFKAKPYENLPGSGLHIHIGVNDMDDNCVLERSGKIGDRDGETEIMLNIIGGLCHTMLKNFTKFAPLPDSYLRFSSKRNNLPADVNPLSAHNNSPVNVSWGGNNRSTAIRIPVSTYDESSRHLEHRVAGADANITDVIEAILEGIYVGVKDKISPPEKISGNAFDKQYSFLTPFPKSLEEAKKL